LNLIELRLAQGSVEKPSALGIGALWYRRFWVSCCLSAFFERGRPMRSVANSLKTKRSVLALAVFAIFAQVPVYGQTVSVLPAVVVTEAPESALAPRGVSLPMGADQVPWLMQSLSSSVITQEQRAQTGGGRLTEVLRFDSSVEANYSPLGYFESFQVRGFPVDSVLGFRVNGVPVVGEAPIFMGNKQQVEVLRGAVGTWGSPGAGGGLLHFVTKRPVSARSMSFSAEEERSIGLATDIGSVDNQGNGWRLNLGADRMRPYAKGADGEAAGLALAIDRQLNAGARLMFDVELSRQEQITQPGSQLLGGRTLPPLRPETVLGLSDWSQPVRFDSVFVLGQLEMPLSNQWLATAKISSHRVKTDDYSSFPWGSGTADPIFTAAADAYFGADGSFILWDYRSLNERRQSDSLSLGFTKDFSVFESAHQVSIGAELIQYLSTKPNYLYATDADWTDPANPIFSAVGNTNSNTWSGEAVGGPGADVFRREIQQMSIYAADRFQWGPGFLDLAARWLTQKEGYRADFSPDYYATIAWRESKASWLLPAITYSLPLEGHQQIWASYRQDIEAGAVAPLSSANNGAVLPSRRLELVELGTKRQVTRSLEASAVVFHSWRPHNFRDDDPGDPLGNPVGDYVQRGKESRTGFELALAGRLGPRLQTQVSATYLESNTSGIGNTAFDGKQALNIPRLRMSALLDYRLPQVSGLSVWAGGFYSGRRPASRDNAIYAPGYTRVDLGVNLAQKAVGQSQVYRFTVENIFNKRYWRDSAEFLGDAYLMPGAPRIFKVSATTNF
jgi:iron complex outermembrane recepter protein